MQERTEAVSSPAQEGYPRYRWVIVALSILFMEASSLVVFSLGVLLPAIRQDLGIDPMQSGWLASVNFLAPVFLSFLASLLVVRFNPKLMAALSMSFCGLFAVLQGLSPVFGVLLAARGLYAVAMTGLNPALALIRLQWIPRNEFATVLGLQSGLANISQTVGFMVTPYLLLAWGSWRPILSLYGTLVFSVAVLWIIFGRQRITPSYQAAMEAQKARSPAWAVLRYKEFWMLGACLFGNIIPWISILTFWPTFLKDSRGFPLTTAGFLTGFLPIGGIVASLTSGFISDRVGLRRPVIWPPGLVISLGYFGMIQPFPIPVLASLSFLVGFLAYMPVPAVMAVPYELPGIKPAEVAVGQSVLSTIMSSASMVGPLLVGVIFRLAGSLYTGLLVTFLFPLTLVVMGLLLPETGPRARLTRPEPVQHEARG